VWMEECLVHPNRLSFQQNGYNFASVACENDAVSCSTKRCIFRQMFMNGEV
jgi:hypothetical protein